MYDEGITVILYIIKMNKENVGCHYRIKFYEALMFRDQDCMYERAQ